MPQQGKSQQTLRNNAWSDGHLQVSDPGCRPLLEWRIWSHNVGPGTSLSCWVTQPGIRNSHCSCYLCAGRAKSIKAAAGHSLGKPCITFEYLG